MIKKVLPNHIVESADTSIPVGKGTDLTKLNGNSFVGMVPYTELGAGSSVVSSVNVDYVGSTLTVTVDGVSDNATIGSGANLTYTPSPTNGVVISDSGTDATIPLANGTNAGLMNPTQFTQLNNITITQAVDLDALEAASHAAVTVTDTATIDFTLTGQNISAIVPDDAITNSKLSNMAANTVKVRAASTTGDPSDIALSASQLLGRAATGDIAPIVLGTGLSMSGTTLNASFTADTIGHNNGASFRYAILSGSPVVTYDTTNATAPILTVTGGTIKLKELWVPYSQAGSTDPIFTINGTVSATRFLSTPLVTKVIENSTTPTIAGTYNQQDIDNTPQVRYGDYTSTSVKVQLASVSGAWNFGFLFTMNQ